MLYNSNPLARVFDLVKQEKNLLYAIYFYAIFMGGIQLSLPLGIQSIINFVMAGSFSMSLALLITLVVAGVFITGLLQVSQMKVIETIRQRIFVTHAYLMAERLPRLDLKKTDSYYLPELVNRFFEIPNLQKSWAKLLLDLPTAAIQILFGLILLSFYHPAFILFGIVLLLLLWLMIAATGKKGLETSIEASNHKYTVAAWLEELARSIKTFKFSKGSALHLRRADDTTSNYVSARTRHFSILLLQYKVLVAFKTIITAAMLVVGAVLLLHQQMNIGQFIASEIVILTIIAAVEKIIVNLDSVYQIFTSVDKIAKVIEKPVESSGTTAVSRAQKVAVSFRNVSFGYRENQPVLNAMSFDIAAGDKVCIRGRDGSGKTTLLKLMTGAYLDFTGSLLINNIPISNYDMASLRSETGIFLNQQEIFEGSLLENITMGAEAVNYDEIMTLARQLGLQEYITQLKEGFNTPLDTSGKRLPANVVHKVLLVRALINQPRLILLEEPFTLLEEPYRSNLKQWLLGQAETTVIVVTNDSDFALQCHQTIHLN